MFLGCCHFVGKNGARFRAPLSILSEISIFTFLNVFVHLVIAKHVVCLLKIAEDVLVVGVQLICSFEQWNSLVDKGFDFLVEVYCIFCLGCRCCVAKT